MSVVQTYGDPTALAMAAMAFIAIVGFIGFFASDQFES